LHVVKDSSCGTHEDVNTFVKRVGLVLDADSTVNCENRKLIGVVLQLVQLLTDLIIFRKTVNLLGEQALWWAPAWLPASSSFRNVYSFGATPPRGDRRQESCQSQSNPEQL